MNQLPEPHTVCDGCGGVDFCECSEEQTHIEQQGNAMRQAFNNFMKEARKPASFLTPLAVKATDADRLRAYNALQRAMTQDEVNQRWLDAYRGRV